MATALNSLHARDIAHNVHPYTNLRAHESRGPMVITEGKGVWVKDDDGKSYIEGVAGLWCAGLGFDEPRLVEAAARQMERLPYTHNFTHRSSEPVIELAEKLVKLAPEGITRAFFVNSGSEAIDTALKLIWYHNNAAGKPEKKRIIARRRAYHGITLAAGHLTGLAYARAGFDLPMADRFFHVTTPSFYRDGLPEEDEDAFTDRLAREIETLIQACGPDTVAAFFAEPVQGAGGVIVPPSSYFPKIQPILKRYGVLAVADEVICGFNRTGETWGCEALGFEPDLMVVAKQLSAAFLPIAGFLMSEPFYQVLADASAKHGNLGMGYTYGGHPVSAAVALETLKIYEERDTLGHVQAVAPKFKARLDRLAEHGLVGEARGIGLLGAVEIVADKKTKRQFDPSAKAAAKVFEAGVREGVVLRATPGDAVGVCPPMVIDEGEIDELFDRFERALDAAAAELA